MSDGKQTRAGNIKQLFANDRQRLVLLLTVGVVVTVTIAGMVMLKKDPHGADNPNAASVSIGDAPRVQTTAGVTKNQRYAEIQAEENRIRAEQAKESGKSMILTPVALQGSPAQVQAAQAAQSAQASQQKPAQPVQQAAPVAPVAPQPVQPQYDQRRVAAVGTGLQRQMESLLNRWVTEGSQVLEYDLTGKPVQSAQSSSTGVSAQQAAQEQKDAKRVLLKAGEIAHAVLKTAINSDQPGPVMADIVSGKFAGGRALGTLTRADDKVVIQFNSIALPNASSSFSVNAYAVDPETSRTAMSSDVDHHYIQRFGLLFASAFIKGYGQAASQPSQTQAMSGSGVITTAKPALDNAQIMKSALGEVGNQAAQVFSQNAQRPVTVTVDAGTPIGILFTQDVQVK